MDNDCPSDTCTAQLQFNPDDTWTARERELLSHNDALANRHVVRDTKMLVLLDAAIDRNDMALAEAARDILRNSP
ncbi:hypothetical protein [Chitiniphilus shinanonensis]|uniref:hypothetical protein n=1 Tax=Chitiniphilus shinanonensis TaxID=553088 RepID=UPI0033411C01